MFIDDYIILDHRMFLFLQLLVICASIFCCFYFVMLMHAAVF